MISTVLSYVIPVITGVAVLMLNIIKLLVWTLTNSHVGRQRARATLQSSKFSITSRGALTIYLMNQTKRNTSIVVRLNKTRTHTQTNRTTDSKCYWEAGGWEAGGHACWACRLSLLAPYATSGSQSSPGKTTRHTAPSLISHHTSCKLSYHLQG